MRGVSKKLSTTSESPSPMCALDSDQDDFQSVRSRAPDRVRLFWGCLVVVCVAISTGYGSQLKFSLLNSATAHFYPPFLMMWFNNCCLIICFPLYLIFERIKSKERSVREITAECAGIIAENGLRSGSVTASVGRSVLLQHLRRSHGHCLPALSLGRITSSAALTVRSFDVSLVYLLGHLILSERFITLKTMAVALATGGVLLIAQDHQFAADLIGVLLVLLSCGVDAIYKVSFKWMAGQASFGQGMFFLSGMALVNLPINALPTVLLLYFGVERWEWAFVPWGSVIGFVLLTFVFNISTIFGVALLNPLIISIGVLCGIPISIGIDVAFRGKQPTVGFLIGAILLVASVVFVTFHEQFRAYVSRPIRCWRKSDAGGAEEEEDEKQRKEEEEENNAQSHEQQQA